MTTFWLSTHLAYACRHSGACCTAGWPIPIERDRAAAVNLAIAAGQIEAPPVWYDEAADAPAEVAGVITRRSDGACVFYRPRPERPGVSWIGGCSIHAHRPASCRHFPYVCVIDPRGVHVTLSHFCPTAANLLFDSDAEVSIVEGPPVPLDGAELEGLDARESLPPVDPQSTRAPVHPSTRAPVHPSTRAPVHPSPRAPVHPSPRAPDPRLLSWDAVTQWERRLVERLAGEDAVPDAPSPLAFDRVQTAVASGWSWPAAPEGLSDAWHALVAPHWTGWRRVIGRYLAARAHASWAMYLGDGLAGVEQMVTLSRTVLQTEAARACLRHNRPLDRGTLTEAIRQSDLLLLHYADPFRLCTAS